MADVSEQPGQSSSEPLAEYMPVQGTSSEAQCSKPHNDNVVSKQAACMNLYPVVVLEKLKLASGPLKVGDRFNTVLNRKVPAAPEKDTSKSEQKRKTWYDENESLSDLSISDIEISDNDELIKPQSKGETKSAQQKPKGKHINKSSSRKESVKGDEIIVVGSKTKGMEVVPTQPKSNVAKGEGKNGTQGTDSKSARPKYENQRKNKRQHSADSSSKAKQSKVDVLAKVVPVSLPMKDTYKIEKNSNSNTRYELHLHSITTSDVGNEAFRKFMNLASDCVVQFTSNKTTSSPIVNGSVVLYFGEASNLQSAMQKLTQLTVLADNTWVGGTIKCVEVKSERGIEKGTLNAQMTFQFNTEKADKLRHLYAYKDRRREGTKRKSALIHRVPLAMNQEMLSLLFPFSLNVHISDVPDQQLRGVRGPVSVEFETEEWMVAVLTCFQNFFFIRPAQHAKPFYLKFSNFVLPAPEKKSVVKGSTSGVGVDHDRSKALKPQQHTQQQREKQLAGQQQREKQPTGQAQRYNPYDRPNKDRNFQSARMKSFGPTKQKTPDRNERNVLPSQVFQQQAPQQFPERAIPQIATPNINIYQLAVSRGLDPTNKDVIKILEMSVQLEAIQAARQNAEGLLKLAEQAKRTADFPVNNAWNQSSEGRREAEGRREETRPFKDNRPMDDYGQAEWIIKENIASKMKLLEDLEQRYKQKKTEGSYTRDSKDTSSTNYRSGENISRSSDVGKAAKSRNRNRSRSPRWSHSSSDHSKHHTSKRTDSPSRSVDYSKPGSFSRTDSPSKSMDYSKARSLSRTDSPSKSRKEKKFRQNYEQSFSKDTETGSTSFFDPNRNDNPLDFNKAAFKISTEQAVKQDLDRTLAVMKDVKLTLPAKGDKSYTAEEMYLPVQFGKNARKKTPKEIEDEKRMAQRSLEETDWSKRDAAQQDTDYRTNQRPRQGQSIQPSDRWDNRGVRKTRWGEEIPIRSEEAQRPQDQQHQQQDWNLASRDYGVGEKDYSRERQHPDIQYSDHDIFQRNKSENIDRRSGHKGPSAGNVKPVAGNIRPLMENVRPLAESAKILDDNTRPFAGSARPLAGSTRPLAGSTRPLAGSTRPLAGSTRPLAVNARPLADNTRPLADNTRPLAGSTRPLAANARPLAGSARPVTRVKRQMYASETEFGQDWGQESNEAVGASNMTARAYSHIPKHNTESVRANEVMEGYDEYQRPLAPGYNEYNSAPVKTSYHESVSDYPELGRKTYDEKHARGNWSNNQAISKKANSVGGRFSKRANPSNGLLGERPNVVPATDLIRQTQSGPSSRNNLPAKYQEENEMEYYDDGAPQTQFDSFKQKPGLLHTPVAEDVGSDQRAAIPVRRLQKPLQEEYYDAGETEEYYDYGQTGEGYDATGYDQTGYDQTGYDQSGYDQTGYNQTGYDQTGYDQTGYNQTGYDQTSYDSSTTEDFSTVRGRRGSFPRSAAQFPSQRGGITHTRGSHTARGGTLPVRGGTLPARGGTQPARGGTLPSRGGTLPSRGGTLPSRGGTQPSRGGITLTRGVMYPLRGGAPRGGTVSKSMSQGWK